MTAAQAVAPFCNIPKRKSRYQADSLLGYPWFIPVDAADSKTVVQIARPNCDKFRNVFVVWDPVRLKILYTDTNLHETKPVPALANRVQWRVLAAGWPFYSQMRWRYYHPNGPKGHEEVKLEYVAAGPDTFVATIRDNHRTFTALRTWGANSRPDGSVQWKAADPPNPFAGAAPAKAALASQYCGWVDDLQCAFYVDKALRRTLYWHAASASWRQYAGRPPTWGAYAGVPWQREGVHLRGAVFHWRDPVTLCLYRLVPDEGYHAVAKFWRDSNEDRVKQLRGVGELAFWFAQAVDKVRELLGAPTIEPDEPDAQTIEPEVHRMPVAEEILPVVEALVANMATFESFRESMAWMAEYRRLQKEENKQGVDHWEEEERAADAPPATADQLLDQIYTYVKQCNTLYIGNHVDIPRDAPPHLRDAIMDILEGYKQRVSRITKVMGELFRFGERLQGRQCVLEEDGPPLLDDFGLPYITCGDSDEVVFTKMYKWEEVPELPAMRGSRWFLQETDAGAAAFDPVVYDRRNIAEEKVNDEVEPSTAWDDEENDTPKAPAAAADIQNTPEAEAAATQDPSLHSELLLGPDPQSSLWLAVRRPPRPIQPDPTKPIQPERPTNLNVPRRNKIQPAGRHPYPQPPPAAPQQQPAQQATPQQPPSAIEYKVYTTEPPDVTDRVWTREQDEVYYYIHYVTWLRYRLLKTSEPLGPPCWCNDDAQMVFLISKYVEVTHRKVEREEEKAFRKAKEAGDLQHKLRFKSKVGLGGALQYNMQSPFQNMFQGDLPCGTKIYPIREVDARKLKMKLDVQNRVQDPVKAQQKEYEASKRQQDADKFAGEHGIVPYKYTRPQLGTRFLRADAAEGAADPPADAAEGAADPPADAAEQVEFLDPETLHGLPRDIDHAEWKEMLIGLDDKTKEQLVKGLYHCAFVDGADISEPCALVGVEEKFPPSVHLLKCIQYAVARHIETAGGYEDDADIKTLKELSQADPDRVFELLFDRVENMSQRLYQEHGKAVADLPNRHFDNDTLERWYRKAVQTKKTLERTNEMVHKFDLVDAYLLSQLYHLRITLVEPQKNKDYTFDYRNYHPIPIPTRKATIDPKGDAYFHMKLIYTPDDEHNIFWQLLVPEYQERLYWYVLHFREPKEYAPDEDAAESAADDSTKDAAESAADDSLEEAKGREDDWGGNQYTPNQRRGPNVDPKRRQTVKDGKATAREYQGEKPAFALAVHEQPWNNYSFFSACRDAVAASLKLPEDSIARLYPFLEAWLQHLLLPPDDAIQRIRQVPKFSQNSQKQPPEMLTAALRNKITQALSSGGDLRLEDDDLLLLAVAGIPFRACFALPPPGNVPDVLVLEFRVCKEVDDELQIPKDSIPPESTLAKTPSKIQVSSVKVPLLLHVPHTQNVGGEGLTPVCHYYHLLCAPAAANLIAKPEAGTADPALQAGPPSCPFAELHAALLKSPFALGVTPESDKGGGLVPANQAGPLVEYRPPPTANLVPGQEVVTTNGTRLVVVNGAVVTRSGDGPRNLLIQTLDPRDVARIVDGQGHENAREQRVAEFSKRDKYVTDLGSLPPASYFHEMRRAYPGVNHLPVIVSTDYKALRSEAAESATDPHAEAIPPTFRVADDRFLEFSLGENLFPGFLERYTRMRWCDVEPVEDEPAEKHVPPPVDFGPEPADDADWTRGWCSISAPARLPRHGALRQMRALRAVLQNGEAPLGMQFEGIDEFPEQDLTARLLEMHFAQANWDNAKNFVLPNIVELMVGAVAARELHWIEIWNARRAAHTHSLLPQTGAFSQLLWRQGEEYPAPEYGCPVIYPKSPFWKPAEFEAGADRFREHTRKWVTHLVKDVNESLIEQRQIDNGNTMPTPYLTNTIPRKIWHELAVRVKRYLKERATLRKGEGMHFEFFVPHDPVSVTPVNQQQHPDNDDRAYHNRGLALAAVTEALLLAAERRECAWIDIWTQRAQDAKNVDAPPLGGTADPYRLGLYRPGEEYPDPRYGSLTPDHHFVFPYEFSERLLPGFRRETEALIRTLALEVLDRAEVKKEILAGGPEGVKATRYFAEVLPRLLYDETRKLLEAYLIERSYRSYVVMDQEEDITAIIAVLKSNTSASLRAPSNRVLESLLGDYSFAPATQPMQSLVELCQSSLPPHAAPPPVQWETVERWMRKRLPTLEAFHAEMLTDMGTAAFVRMEEALRAPPTLSLLQILARGYSSENEQTPGKRLDREIPYLNFVVVRYNPNAAQRQQLEVVLHSDPRGLQLAMDLHRAPQALGAFSNTLENVSEAARELRRVYGAHQKASVAVILQMPGGGGFYLMHATPSRNEALERYKHQAVATFPFNNCKTVYGALHALVSECEDRLAEIPERPTQKLKTGETARYKVVDASRRWVQHAAYNNLDQSKKTDPRTALKQCRDIEAVRALARQNHIRIVVFQPVGESSVEISLHHILDHRRCVSNKRIRLPESTWYCIMTAEKCTPIHPAEPNTDDQTPAKPLAEGFVQVAACIQSYLALIDALEYLVASLGLPAEDTNVELIAPDDTNPIQTQIPGRIASRYWRQCYAELPSMPTFGDSTRNNSLIEKMLTVMDTHMSFLYLVRRLIYSVLPARDTLKAYLGHVCQLNEQRDDDVRFNPRLRFYARRAEESTKSLDDGDVEVSTETLTQVLNVRRDIVAFHMGKHLLDLKEAVAPCLTHGAGPFQDELLRVFSEEARTIVHCLQIEAAKKCSEDTRRGLRLMRSKFVRAYRMQDSEMQWSLDEFKATNFCPMLPYSKGGKFYLISNEDWLQVSKIRRLMRKVSEIGQRRVEVFEDVSMNQVLREELLAQLNLEESSIHAALADTDSHTDLEDSGRYEYDSVNRRFVYASVDAGRSQALEAEIVALKARIEQERLEIARVQKAGQEIVEDEDRAAYFTRQEANAMEIKTLEASVAALEADAEEKQRKLHTYQASAGEPVVDPRLDGCSLRYDWETGRYEWKSGENAQLYYMQEDLLGPETPEAPATHGWRPPLQDCSGVYRNLRRWERSTQPPRDLCEPCSRFPNVWYDPTLNALVCMDYRRELWRSEYEEQDGKRTGPRKEWVRVDALTPMHPFIEVEPSTEYDTLPSLIEDHCGVPSSDFSIKIKDFTGGAIRSHAEVDIFNVGAFSYHVHRVRLCKPERDGEGGADDADLPPAAAEDLEEKGLTFLKATYEHMCFVNYYNGICKNPFGVDYGLSGHPEYQDPESAFRQACILAFRPDRLGVIYRRGIPKTATHSDLDELRRTKAEFMARPNWDHVKNVERYWGANTSGVGELDPQLYEWIVRCPERLRNKAKRRYALSLREVYGTRATMMFHWLTDTRNWYWDAEGRRFVAFCYSPHLVWAKPETKEHGEGPFLVQELVMYRVDNLFAPSNGGYKEASDACKEYIRLRQTAEDVWKNLEDDQRAQTVRRVPPHLERPPVEPEQVPEAGGAVMVITGPAQATQAAHRAAQSSRAVTALIVQGAVGRGAPAAEDAAAEAEAPPEPTARGAFYDSIDEPEFTFKKGEKITGPKEADKDKHDPTYVEWLDGAELSEVAWTKGEMVKKAQASPPVMKYYTDVTQRFLELADTSKRAHGELLLNASLVNQIMSDRQVRTRGLFLRLFKTKFGRPYHSFLHDENFRREIYMRVPEFNGPGRVSASAPERFPDAKAERIRELMEIFKDKDSEPDKDSVPEKGSEPDFMEVFDRLHPPDGGEPPEEYEFNDDEISHTANPPDTVDWNLQQADLYHMYNDWATPLVDPGRLRPMEKEVQHLAGEIEEIREVKEAIQAELDGDRVLSVYAARDLRKQLVEYAVIEKGITRQLNEWRRAVKIYKNTGRIPRGFEVTEVN
jgi:hypothetical protein